MRRTTLLTLVPCLFALTACGEGGEALTTPLAAEAGRAAQPPAAAGPRAPRPGDATIAEIAEDAGFTLLLQAVGYVAETNPESSLVEKLLDDDQLTVFAPTDEAFVGLVEALTPLLDPDVLGEEGPFAAIDALLGAGTVETVLRYHVTEGRRAANSVVPPRGERTIETLAGVTFSVEPSARITAVGSSAEIGTPDVSGSNGIIHVIDTVLLPVDLGL